MSSLVRQTHLRTLDIVRLLNCACPPALLESHSRSGYYRAPTRDDQSNCELCPTGATCDPGAEVETLIMDEGYWRLSNKTVDIRRCPYDSDGAFTPCRGGVTDAEGALCVPGTGRHHGPLCKGCGNGFYFDDMKARCEICPDEGGTSGIILGVVFAIAGSLSALTWIYLRPPRRLMYVSQRLHQLHDVLKPLGIWPKLKQYGTVGLSSWPKQTLRDSPAGPAL